MYHSPSETPPLRLSVYKREPGIAESLISEDDGGVIKKLGRNHLKELFRLGQQIYIL